MSDDIRRAALEEAARVAQDESVNAWNRAEALREKDKTGPAAREESASLLAAVIAASIRALKASPASPPREAPATELPMLRAKDLQHGRLYIRLVPFRPGDERFVLASEAPVGTIGEAIRALGPGEWTADGPLVRVSAAPATREAPDCGDDVDDLPDCTPGNHQPYCRRYKPPVERLAEACPAPAISSLASATTTAAPATTSQSQTTTRGRKHERA